MSLFCVFVANGIAKRNEIEVCVQQIHALAQKYKRGIKWTIDWNEPTLTHIPTDALLVNILDCSNADNCELLLLPDGWYSNGQTNHQAFKERMRFLQDVSEVLCKWAGKTHLYLGESGSCKEEFVNVSVRCDCIAEYLANSVGITGVDGGIHIDLLN